MPLPPLRKYDCSEPTRFRILQTAGMLFAARGYASVGMRDIAADADVSLRMANYHFGSKARLFAACTRLALNEGVGLPALFADNPVFPDREAARQAILDKVAACSAAFQAPGRAEWHGGVIFRAMLDGSDEAFDVFQEGLRLTRRWFDAALPQACPGMPAGQAFHWQVTFWAHVLFQTRASRAIRSATGGECRDDEAFADAGRHLRRLMDLLLAPAAQTSAGGRP